MRRFVALPLLLLVLLAGSVSADVTLEGAVAAAFLLRTPDSELHDIAHQRAVEVSTDWSHNGIRADTAEVLAHNSGYSDPIGQAVLQWIASPDHAAVLSDPYWDAIGCGSYLAGVTWYFACVLRHGATDPPTAPTAPTTNPAPLILPDARMEGSTTDDPTS